VTDRGQVPTELVIRLKSVQDSAVGVRRGVPAYLGIHRQAGMGRTGLAGFVPVSPWAFGWLRCTGIEVRS
jgi:hypothetical protein